jgi:tyrosinase
MVVSLGPKSTVVNNIPKNPQSDGLGSNPRCLRRDVNKFSAAGATANYTLSLILNNTEIDTFYNRYLGQPPLKNDPHPWGLHNAGHYIIGGDPGGVSLVLLPILSSPASRTVCRRAPENELRTHT